jgi:hypothetical protein
MSNLSPEQFKPFDAVRPETQRAVMQYASEGEVENPRAHVEQFEYVERSEPLEQVKRGVMESGDTREIADDFDSYHQWYVGARDTPQHTERWPSIRSSSPEDAGYFEDGWHRFHSYVAQGDATIPTVEMRPRQEPR